MKSMHASGLGCFANPGIFIVLLALTGCQANRAADVQLRSLDGGREMSQRFTQASFSRNEGGDYDIVLVEAAMPQTDHRRGKGDAIEPSDAVPLTQVLHVKVLWRPKRAIRPDSPTATNASVHWSVLAGDGTGRVDYDGVGFANVYGGEDQIRAILRNVTLQPAGRTGTLNDPIGPSSLEADFKARRDPAKVHSVLEMTRQRTAPAVAADARNSPPVRLPGP
jgi:hypothetical protein